MRSRVKRLAYLDLYCGPGRYKKTGDPSTPALIMEEVLRSSSSL